MSLPHASNSDDSLRACEQAIALARQSETLSWDLAELLSTIKEQELWRSTGSESYNDFLEQHVRLKPTTARQMTKVQRMCREQGVSKEQMEELGWAKLAEVADTITPENKEAVLKEVSELSLAELRRKQREAKALASGEQKKPGKPTIIFTEEIQEALRRAARFTKSDDTQVNLEFIAKSFKQIMPHSPVTRFSLN